MVVTQLVWYRDLLDADGAIDPAPDRPTVEHIVQLARDCLREIERQSPLRPIRPAPLMRRVK
jgi:hypothetical protein